MIISSYSGPTGSALGGEPWDTMSKIAANVQKVAPKVQNVVNKYGPIVKAAATVVTGKNMSSVPTPVMTAPPASGAKAGGFKVNLGPLLQKVNEQLPTGLAPVAAPYTGCTARYSVKRGVWSIYCPVGHPMTMTPGGVTGFGDAGAGEIKVGESTTKPPEAADGGPDDKPFYKTLWFWGAVIGGAAILGGGYYYMRKRK